MHTRQLIIASVIVSLVAAEIELSICVADPPSKPVSSNGEGEVATIGVLVNNSQASTGNEPSGEPCNPQTSEGRNTEFAQPSRGVADMYNEIDPAFAKFVDLVLLTEAMSGPNVAQLTDVALGLAEGERVLVRLHRAGLTADTLMAKVVKLAARANDTAVLERVSKTSTNIDRPQWAKLVAEAKEFGGTSRDDLMIPLGKIDLNTVSLLEQVRQACDKAELTGEKHILEELKKAVAVSEVDPKVKAYATELIESAIKDLPEKPNELDSLLGEFASASRQYARKQVQPFVSYQDDSLKILFRSSDLEPELAKYLKSMMPIKQSSNTRNVRLDNPRVEFTNGAIRVRLNYSVGFREIVGRVPAPTLTDPFRTRTLYSPWVTDSGWVEADVRTPINNWILSLWTRSAYVRWTSNNSATRLIAGEIDSKVRNLIADSVNKSIVNTFGSQDIDIKRIVLELAAPVLSRNIGSDEDKVRSILYQSMQTIRLDVENVSEGILINGHVPRYLFDSGGHPSSTSGPELLRTGQLFIANDYRGDVTIALYHPADPSRDIGHWPIRDGSPPTRLIAPNGQELRIGQDWEIEVIFGNGVRSPRRTVGSISSYSNGAFQIKASAIYGGR